MIKSVNCGSVSTGISLFAGSMMGISEDVKEQLSDAAMHTGKAYAAVRRGRDPEAEVEPSRPMPSSSLFGTDLQSASGKHEVKTMSPEVLVMKPILRFLQLLCENHNRDLQVSEPSGSFVSFDQQIFEYQKMKT